MCFRTISEGNTVILLSPGIVFGFKKRKNTNYIYIYIYIYIFVDCLKKLNINKIN